MDPIHTLALDRWTPAAAAGTGLAAVIESGQVLYLPQLRFALADDEARFLDPRWQDPASKNIAWTGSDAGLRGARAHGPDADDLRALMARFRSQACALVARLCPGYVAAMQPGSTSYRPLRIDTRRSDWRSDDRLLHLDAFPRSPTGGRRILRVFSNVHPLGEPREWRLGERFETVARRLLPRVPRPWPGAAAWLQLTRRTRGRRSEYDHLMLGLHDAMKRDPAEQREDRMTALPCAAGSTWICFADQVPHAVRSGQFMFEQTLLLPVAAQADPATSPLRTLERLIGRPLA